jgi:hypothetical protein
MIVARHDGAEPATGAAEGAVEGAKAARSALTTSAACIPDVGSLQTRPGIVTVKHPAKDFPVGTLKSMERQSGVKLT